MTQADYSFPSREEYFRLLEEEWRQSHPTPSGDSDSDSDSDSGSDGDGGDGKSSGAASLNFDFTKQTIRWFFDPVSLTIYSPQLNKQISLKKLDAPAKISRLLVVLSRSHTISSAAVYFALEQAAHMIYRDSLFNVLSFHARHNVLLAWAPLENDLIFDRHHYHRTGSPS